MLLRTIPRMVCSLAKEKWTAEGTVEDKWMTIKTALTEAAQSVLGKEGRLV